LPILVKISQINSGGHNKRKSFIGIFITIALVFVTISPVLLFVEKDEKAAEPVEEKHQ